LSIDEAQEQLLRKNLTEISDQSQEAIAFFYDATIDFVYGLALRITHRPEDAEEVVSDTYLQVWNKAAQFDEARCSAFGWLMMICRSRALDQLRRRQVLESKLQSQEYEDISPSYEDEPQDFLNVLDRKAAVYSAMKNLKPTHRQLVGLAFFQGLSHREIAAHVDMPLGSVKTHIRKGLSLLKSELQRSDYC